MIHFVTTVSLAGSAPLPGPLTVEPWQPTAPQVWVLSNGVPLYFIHNPEVPLFEVTLVVPVGEQHDPAGLEGATSLAFDLADEGAGDLDAAGFARATRAIGCQINSGTAGDYSTVRVSGLADDTTLERALDLWTSAIREPNLSAADLTLSVARRIQRLALDTREPSRLADRVRAHLQYGDTYLGRHPTEASLRAIDRDALVRQWTLLSPRGAALVAGGDVDSTQLIAMLEARLGDWSAAEASVAPPLALAPVDAEQIFVVDVKGASQSAVRAWWPAGQETDPDGAALSVAIEALGGAFTSRVNTNLREDKGWTYGSRCNLSYRAGPGLIQCGAMVRADASAGAIREIRREIDEVQGQRPLTDAEFADFRASLLRATPIGLERLAAQLGEQTRLHVRGLPTDFTASTLVALGAIDLAASDAALRNRLSGARPTWLVVGDLATIRADLEGLGLPLIVVEP